MSRGSIAGYAVAAGMGAVAGGVAVARLTHALPKMMSGMMSQMMAGMGGEGCSPAEM